jgi:hypothetical protein
MPRRSLDRFAGQLDCTGLWDAERSKRSEES